MKKLPIKVLICEDDQNLARILEIELNNCADFKITLAHDGEDGISVLKKNKFDIIILDIIMPKKNGFHVLKYIKDHSIKTHVVVFSNLGQEGDIAKAKSLGASDYFVKSGTPIVTLVQHVCKKSASKSFKSDSSISH